MADAYASEINEPDSIVALSPESEHDKDEQPSLITEVNSDDFSFKEDVSEVSDITDADDLDLSDNENVSNNSDANNVNIETESEQTEDNESITYIEPSSEPETIYTYSDADKTVYATISLNVQSGPSVDFDVIGAYNVNDGIEVTGVCNETGWYRVNYNGTTGYCDAGCTADSIVMSQSESEESVSDESCTAQSDSSSGDTSIYYNIVSAGDNGVSSYYVELVQQAFNSVPQWVQNSFANNGWHVYVRSGSWWYDYGWSVQLKGLTHYDNHAIYISGRDDSANYHTVAHETGHYVDWLYNWPSHTSQFNGIYNSEYRQFCSYYSYSNGYPGVEELFAEGLYHYWTDPGTLASVAPQTYNYINGIFS